MIENEYKAQLNVGQYRRLCKLLLQSDYKCNKVTQKNYYYDTYTYKYDRKNITIRIREKEYLLEGCIKKHAANNPGSLESYFTVATAPENFYYKDDLVYKYGASETTRIKVQLTPEIELDIDETLYLEKKDYELELEFHDSVKAEAYKIYTLICSFLGCNESKDSKSKSQRFFERWRQINQKF